MKMPVTITITVLSHGQKPYRASLAGWGVDDLGHYGSQWSRSFELPETGPGSTARDVLAELCEQLAGRVVDTVVDVD